MIVGAGTAIGVAATGDDGPPLRVAPVRIGSVDRTVDASGTVTSSLKLTPSFPTSGTVDSVEVKAGDTVRKGQVLAQLDAAALQAEVDSADATLASARQQLEADRTGQTSGSSDATTAAYLTASHAGSSSSVGSLIRQVEAAQDRVIAAQKQVDAAQAAIDAAQQAVDTDVRQNTRLRDAQQQACASSNSSSPAPSSSSSTSSSGCEDARAAYEASADTLSASMATLDEKISTQDRHLKDLDTAITSLDKLVDQLQSAAASSGSGSGGSSSSSPSSTPSSSAPSRPSTSAPSRPTGSAPSRPSTSAPSRPSGSSNQPNGGGSADKSSSPSNGSRGSSEPSAPSDSSEPASAAQLAADQKAIDAAEAQLRVAQQNLAAATLKSPASGKVAAVGFVAGQSSSGKSITIVGTGVPGVEATVPLGQVDQVKVGQSVTVAVDGVATKLHGTVTSIAMLNSSSGSNPSYRVTVQLDATSRQLYDGSGADLVISTGSARNVLTVPNSAIHSTVSGGHTVTVLEGGRTRTVRVTLGVSGSDVTEVKSGLKAGQKVVLADPSEPLPGSATNNSGKRDREFSFPGGGGPVNLGGK